MVDFGFVEEVVENFVDLFFGEFFLRLFVHWFDYWYEGFFFRSHVSFPATHNESFIKTVQDVLDFLCPFVVEIDDESCAFGEFGVLELEDGFGD